MAIAAMGASLENPLTGYVGKRLCNILNCFWFHNFLKLYNKNLHCSLQRRKLQCINLTADNFHCHKAQWKDSVRHCQVEASGDPRDVHSDVRPIPSERQE